MSEPTPLFAPLKPAVGGPRLWTSHGFVEDVWQVVGDQDALPAAPAIVSLTRWRAESAALRRREQPVGVIIQATESVDSAADHLTTASMIALVFPKFSDGRAYSTALRLREAGNVGQIRATGDVLLDQIPLMLRTGFDAFEIVDVATAAALARGVGPALLPAYQRRRAG